MINSICIEIPEFDLDRSCNCGQAFRWQKVSDNAFSCVISGNAYKAEYHGNELCISSPQLVPDEAFFKRYFDVNTNYAEIEALMRESDILRPTIAYGHGIRVFHQEPFETLISFIISANNNISRIRSIIERLCRLCGDKVISDSDELYAFPTKEQLSAVTEDELTKIGLGYRAAYIAKTMKILNGGFSLDSVQNMQYTDAKKELCKLCGVGGKVADCVLLFAFGFGEAFPTDVWIKRAMSIMFFDGNIPKSHELNEIVSSFGNNAGIIQQYIFHYARSVKLCAEQ